MEMAEVSRLMEEYFKTVTPEQFEKDAIEAGILECPDKFIFEVQGDSVIFNYKPLLSDKLITADLFEFQEIDIQTITINVSETSYCPHMNESQYVIPGKVA